MKQIEPFFIYHSASDLGGGVLMVYDGSLSEDLQSQLTFQFRTVAFQHGILKRNLSTSVT